jgi:hypothetical protein
MRCWLFHDWELIKEGVSLVSHFSPLLGQRWKEEAFARLYKCRRCGKEKAELISMDGSKQSIDPLFLKE